MSELRLNAGTDRREICHASRRSKRWLQLFATGGEQVELLEGIKSRRAIRKFKKESVPLEIIERAVEMAKWSPVAPPFRRWQYEVVTGSTCSRLVSLINANSIHLKHMLEAFSEEDRAKIIEYYQSLGNTQCLVLVTTPPIDDVWEKKYRMVLIGTELEVFLLSLYVDGVGACGLTITPNTEREILDILGIRDRELVVGFAIGYPDESPEPIPRDRAPINLYAD